ncbi:putative alkaline serine protease [Dendryphion nanum]|uniref:Alkaline serine protease n=1 Tax=Dendryphion nanum TaxID=256645 RepID=A0A9P9D014_9PLEO|nr:putative alkaline serine protease [Dendryphion nanum]
MAPAKQWVVRYKHFVTHDQQSDHVARVNSLSADSTMPFSAKINRTTKFSIGSDTKGYLAEFDIITKVLLEALPEVRFFPTTVLPHVSIVTQKEAPWSLARLSNTGPLTGSKFAYTYRTDASGAGVIAYIIDTGINEKHVEFESRASKGPIFVEGGATSSKDDVVGHGTHVAGTIGGKTYGVAKNVTLVGIKVFDDHTGSASTIDIIKALEWVVTDVYSSNPPKKAVANLSLGGDISPAMDAAIAAAVRQGIIVVVAAGNKDNSDNFSPAREPLAITVGATDINDNRASFSNWGRKVDIFAPGVNIMSAWIAAPGHPTTNKETKRIDGTSMASPHVAGVAATILSDKQHTVINNAQDVIGTILINADKSGVGNLDNPALLKVNPKFTTIASIAQAK